MEFGQLEGTSHNPILQGDEADQHGYQTTYKSWDDPPSSLPPTIKENAPWKINMDTNNSRRFGSDDFPFQRGDFWGFQPLIF